MTAAPGPSARLFFFWPNAGFVSPIQVADVKVKSAEPEFVPGVVLKISGDKPFTSRKTVKVSKSGTPPPPQHTHS